MCRVDISHDPTIDRFRKAVKDLYGDRVDRLVLYGSRARGDATGDSDYDIAVFFRPDASLPMPNRRAIFDALAVIQDQIFEDTGAVINALPMPATSWTKRTLLMHAIRSEGLEL